MLMLAGSYLSNFQNWLKFSQDNRNSDLNQSVMPSGIRAISSSDSFRIESTFSHSDINPSLASAIDPQPLEVATHHSSETVNISAPRLATANTNRNVISLGPTEVPTFIQYEDELILEFPKDLATESNLKRAISKILLSSSVLKDKELLSVGPIKTQYKPLLYKKVLDQYGQAIRYPAAANKYAEYLLEKHTQEVVDTEGRFIIVQIPLVSNQLPRHIERYKAWVDSYGERFKVPSDLIFAIMEVESAFNPRAVSKSNALGLMQIKANTAGKDVFELIDNKAGMPSRTELFDAQNNIRIGSAYMGLLKYEYLAGVKNVKNRELLLISAYNGGISTVLKLFGNTPDQSITRINQLHPRQVYRSLRYNHASEETRNYLDKVLKTKSKYTEMLDLTA